MAAPFEVTVGLEIHAQIATKTKLFCRCSNDSFGLEPNVNVCPICMGFPGMLPSINRDAFWLGVKAALALGCSIPPFSKFDRKNYFYPDLPKGFQISQYDEPVSKDGGVAVLLADGTRKHVRIGRLHLEDDAGKLTHTSSGTLCDYNRSGCPLMEIVSEPDMTTVEEASLYAQEIRRILRNVGASECDMEKGMMRFDLNVSIRPAGQKEYGTKVEVKNLNSFRSLERALVYEIERQTEMVNRGEKIMQETRGWDDVKALTSSQRSKEAAHDYRYFPEPDLPPIEVSEEEVAAIKKTLPELPSARCDRFLATYGLSNDDAHQLSEDRSMADYFEKMVTSSQDPKKSASFLNTILLKNLNRDGLTIAQSPIKPEQFGALVELINKGTISNNQAKNELFEEMYKTGKDADLLVKEMGIAVVSDAGEIEAVCKKIVEANATAAADFKSGKESAIGFLVGQIMKESKGKANPALVQQTLRKLLS